MKKSATNRRKGKDLVVLLIAASCFLGAGLGSRDLWNPNEPSYGRVVVEMLETGDWLVPRLNGEPFVEKPIMYFWMAAAASKVLGSVSETILRIPVVLLGVLSVLLVYLLVEAYDGQRRARIASAIFVTLYGVWFTARTAQMDSFVLVTTLAVVLILTRRLDHDAGAASSWLLAGLAAGFGFVGKGPVTVLVPGLIVFCYIVLGRRPWRRLLPGLPLGLAAFFVVALPWYVALYLSGHSEALYELLFRQNVTRFVAAWDHLQPWWYYLKYFWLTFAPWSWFIPIVVVSAVRGQTEGAGEAQRLAWIWLLAPLIFFSLSQSKREPYLLPIAPAVAWLTAWLFDEFLKGKLRRWQTIACTAICGMLGAILLLGGVTALWSGTIDMAGREVSFDPVGVPLVCAGIAVLSAILLRGTRRISPVLAWISFSFFLLFVGVYALQTANPVKSHRQIATEIAQKLPEESPLYSYFGRFRVVRGGYPYYLGRSVPDLADEDDLRAIWAAEPRPCVIYEAPEYRDLIENLPRAEFFHEGRVGGKFVRLICRAPTSPDAIDG